MDKNLYEFVLNKEHHKYRKEIEITFDKNMTPIERMTYRFEQMAKAEGVNERLKIKDQMLWVARMNNIRNRAEEIIHVELIYD